jgi:hypothetical protein
MVAPTLTYAPETRVARGFQRSYTCSEDAPRYGRDDDARTLHSATAAGRATPDRCLASMALVGSLHEAALATRRVEARLIRVQARQLGWLSDEGRMQRCGFAGVRNLAVETLGLRPRTTRSRLMLFRQLEKHPQLERAFIDGVVSACQVPYIAKLIEMACIPEAGLAGFILDLAAEPVHALRHAVREAEAQARREENDARGDAETDAASADAGSREADAEPDVASTDLPDDVPDDLPDDPETIPFAFKHPLGFRVAFDEMMERARMVLGYDAPIPDCIEAMLAEIASPGVGGDGPRPHLLSPDRAIPKRPSVTVLVRPEAIEHAKTTLARVAEYLDDVAQIESLEQPDSPEEALLILRQVQLLRAPGKVLLAHLIRDLRRVGAVELLGYTSLARMVEDLLKISERSARNRAAESSMFESNAAIEAAFGTGQISTMQAHLIRQLKSTEAIEEFVERARETTWRQFQREYRLLILMRKCNLGRHALRPLSKGNVAEAIEAALIEAMGKSRDGGAQEPEGQDRSLEAAREAIEDAMRIRGIPPLPPDSSTDPAENPVLMDRLETMVQLLALRHWDELPATGEADRQTLANLQTEVWTRFRLPKQTYIDLKCILGAYRCVAPPNGGTARPPGDAPRVPEWVAMAMFFAEVRAVWDLQDPERVPVRARILERDHYRCVVPGCTRRDQLETHHIQPRSHGGGNDAGNLAALCHGHHQHGVHAGHVKIRGTAPHGLRYELGRRRDGSPLLVYQGNRLIRGPFDS